MITHLRARLRSLNHSQLQVPTQTAGANGERCELVAIGASTGGPAAILELLRAIPANFPIQLAIVIHIGDTFAGALADWLDGQTVHRVRYAKHGAPLQAFANQVVLAPPAQHLSIQSGRLSLSDEAARHSCRPSVDVLFESVAQEYGPRAVGCLLTGMGRDGASGLLAMRNAGALTIAQDEATSVVYGMPREAALLGAASRVLPLDQIGPTIAALAASAREKTKDER